MYSRSAVADRLEIFTAELRKPCKTDRVEEIAELLRSWSLHLDLLAESERQGGYAGEAPRV